MSTVYAKSSARLAAVSKSVSSFRELGILAALVVICLVTAVINPVFLTPENLIDVFRSTSFTLICSVGMTFVLVSAGLDLSVGSILGLSGMLAGLCLVNGWSPPLAILVGLAGGSLLGLVNGLIIVRFRIPPLIVTLGTMYIGRGIIYVATQGRPLYPFPNDFNQIGQGTLFSVPYSIYLAAALVAVGIWVLRKTTFGRSVYALGGNEEASRVAGISIGPVKVGIYVIAAFTASITGILMASRLSSAQAAAGTGWELTVIASVIIGGTSMFGGVGTLLGTVIGTTIMCILTNAMVLMGVDVYWQKIVVGIIIILAVGMDTYGRRRLSGGKG